MVRVLFALIFSVLLLEAYSLDRELSDLMGKKQYQTNRGLIHILMKDKHTYLKNGEADFQKLTKLLDENHLLDLNFKHLRHFKLSFATKQKNALLFIKIVKEVLASTGYSQTLTTKATRDESGFLWEIELVGSKMVNPYLLVSEFQKRGATITHIRRRNRADYRYDVDIYSAKVKALVPPKEKEVRLPKPMHPYWIDIYGARQIKIVSMGGNRWHPYIVFYDRNLKIVGNYTKERKSYNISLKIPSGAQYIKIADLYTLQNLKRGIKITLFK